MKINAAKAATTRQIRSIVANLQMYTSNILFEKQMILFNFLGITSTIPDYTHPWYEIWLMFSRQMNNAATNYSRRLRNKKDLYSTRKSN